jgi:DNA-binding CsgD family transcriptional regulator
MLAERHRVVSYRDAIDSNDEVLRLKAHALGAAVAVVPATTAAFVAVTRRRTLEGAVGIGTGDGDPWSPGWWERYLDGGWELDPGAPQRMAASSAAVLTLDDLGAAAARFRWYLRTQGLNDRITMYLRSAGRIVAAIMIGRSVTCERFTTEDAGALRRIHPLLEHAYLCAVEPRGGSAREALRLCGLTDRELDVAELVGRGAANAEIARSLHVSQATVKTHLMRIFAKAGVHSRTQLAVLLGAGTDG